MRTLSLILMAAIGAASATAEPPQPHRYDVQVRLIEGGKLIASPRLIIEAGKLATFLSDDGEKGWSLKLRATPDKSGTVALASDLETWFGQGSRRRATTTLLVGEGQPAAFELSPQASLPSMRVELSIDSL